MKDGDVSSGSWGCRIRIQILQNGDMRDAGWGVRGAGWGCERV